MNWHRDLRTKSGKMCADVSAGGARAPVQPYSCHGAGGNQLWRYHLVSPQFFVRYHFLNDYTLTPFFPFLTQDSQILVQGGNHRCLDMDSDRKELFVSPCVGGSPSQKWTFQHVNEDRVRNWNSKP